MGKDGKPAGEYYLVVKPGEAGYKEGKHAKPDFTLVAEDADLIQLLSNKLDPIQAFMGGKIKIKGNMMLGMQFQELQKKRLRRNCQGDFQEGGHRDAREAEVQTLGKLQWSFRALLRRSVGLL